MSATRRIAGWAPPGSTPSSIRPPARSTAASSATRRSTTTRWRQIFGRAWLMIGHESLVPARDDFFHTYMGEDPVILTRDGQGRLHALLNMCRHRGNRVVRCDDGNAKRFMCTYHGWTYRNDGALDHVPGESEAYYDALDKQLPRPHRGPRRDLCGDRLRHLGQGRPEPRGLPGRRALVPRHRVQPARRRHAGAGPDEVARAGQLEDHGRQLLRQLPRPDQPSLQRPRADPLPRPPAALAQGPVREPEQARLRQRPLDHLPRRRRQHAPLRARHVDARPSSCSRSTTTRPCPRSSGGSARSARAGCSSATTASSRTASSASAWPCRAARSRPSSGTSCCVDRDAPEALKRAIRIGSQANNGAAGMFEQDDVDNWRQVTAASTSRLGRRYPQDLSMGLGHAGRASGVSRARLRALHLGEQPAPVLPALGGVHERGELGGHRARPDQGPLRGHRDHAGLAAVKKKRARGRDVRIRPAARPATRRR